MMHLSSLSWGNKIEARRGFFTRRATPLPTDSGGVDLAEVFSNT